MGTDDRLLGRLEEFQKHSEKRFNTLEKKVDALNEFKWRMVGAAGKVSILMTVVVEIAKWVFHSS